MDLAVVVTPAQTVPGGIGECVDAGVKGAIIISAGFKKTGAAGEMILNRANIFTFPYPDTAAHVFNYSAKLPYSQQVAIPAVQSAIASRKLFKHAADKTEAEKPGCCQKS